MKLTIESGKDNSHSISETGIHVSVNPSIQSAYNANLLGVFQAMKTAGLNLKVFQTAVTEIAKNNSLWSLAGEWLGIEYKKEWELS